MSAFCRDCTRSIQQALAYSKSGLKSSLKVRHVSTLTGSIQGIYLTKQVILVRFKAFFSLFLENNRRFWLTRGFYFRGLLKLFRFDIGGDRGGRFF